jgi:hypothetical protein
MTPFISQAQKFATAYAATLAKANLATIQQIRWAATLIMALAMSVSFTHQLGYLHSIGMGLYAAIAAPVALDALTFICIKGIATRGTQRSGKIISFVVMIFPVTISSTINFLGAGEPIVKLAYVAMVCMIPAAELVAAVTKPDFVQMDEMERKVMPVSLVEARGNKCEVGCTCGKHAPRKSLKPTKARRIVERKPDQKALAS